MRKSYNSLDIGICMCIQEGYGLGTNLQRLLQRYWDDQVVVMKAGKYFGQPFGMERGVTLGNPVFLEKF